MSYYRNHAAEFAVANSAGTAWLDFTAGLYDWTDNSSEEVVTEYRYGNGRTSTAEVTKYTREFSFSCRQLDDAAKRIWGLFDDTTNAMTEFRFKLPGGSYVYYACTVYNIKSVGGSPTAMDGFTFDVRLSEKHASDPLAGKQA